MGKRAERAPIPCAGVLATACTQGRRWQHGKPDSVVGRDDQPEAGDGQRGRYGVAERPVLLKKPGNAGGGKGPWFKTGTESSKAQEIGATLYNSGNVRELRTVPHAEAKKELGFYPGSECPPRWWHWRLCAESSVVAHRSTRLCVVDQVNCG